MEIRRIGIPEDLLQSILLISQPALSPYIRSVYAREIYVEALVFLKLLIASKRCFCQNLMFKVLLLLKMTVVTA